MNRGRLGLLVVAVLGAAGFWPASAEAQQRCRGTKVFFAGKCRYPKEVSALKRADANRRAAAKKKQQAAADKRAADERSCERARKMKSIDGWRMYIDAFPKGTCVVEAEKQMAALAAAPPPVEKKEPPPAKAPEPLAPAAPPDAAPSAPSSEVAPKPAPVTASTDVEPSGVSPMVYIGFGVAAAGVVAGAVTGGLSFSQSKDLQERCPNDACAPELQSEIDTMMTLGHVSTASFALAGAGAVLGVVGLVMGPSSPQGADAADAAKAHLWQVRLSAQGAKLHWRF